MAACVLGPMAALVYRARAINATYNGAPLLVPPMWLAWMLATGGAIAMITVFVRELRATRSGERVDGLALGVMFITNGTWIALLVFIRHPALPFYALASGHYVQYLYFVWRQQHRTEALTVLPSVVRERIAPPSRGSYLAALLAIGGAVTVALTLIALGLRGLATIAGLRPAAAMATPPWAAAMLAINLQHYWLDHRIWRAPRRTPSVAVAARAH